MGATQAEFIFGWAGNNVLDASTAASGVTLFGEAGADQLIGSAFNDVFYVDSLDTLIDANAGNDVLVVYVATGQSAANTTIDVGAAEVEYVLGGAGNDTLNAATAATGVTLDGMGGADQLTGSAFDDVIYVDNLDTLVDASAGNDVLAVSAGTTANTTIDVAAAEAEWVRGGVGDDTLTNAGRNASVTLLGADGNDTLTGGLANDYLYGDAEGDTFVVTANAQFDAILDFENNSDLIDVQALNLDNAQVQAIINAGFENGSGDCILNFGASNQLFLYQVAKAQLDTGDFVV